MNMGLPYRVPSFPLTVNVYYGGDPFPGPPRATYPCALWPWMDRDNQSAGGGFSAFLLAEKEAQLGDYYPSGISPFYELPAGSGTLWVASVAPYDVHKGFPNEFRAVFIGRYTALNP
jgi:hypothetical protein